jgi:hypothetical protein
MADNVYFMPAVGVGTKADPRRAKYQTNLAAAGVMYAQHDYGGEPTFMVAVRNIPAALHTTISGDAACLVVPDLDVPIGTRLTNAVNKLEAMNVPASWMADTQTFRQALRVVYAIFDIAERLLGLGRANLFQAGVTLDTTFGSLAAGVRQDLRDVADSFTPPLDYSAVTNSTTIRQLFKGLADQRSGSPVTFGPVTL